MQSKLAVRSRTTYVAAVNRGLVVLALSVLLGGSSHAAPAEVVEAPPVYRAVRAGIGYHYSVGDYGGATSTSIIYLPFTARAEIGRWTLWGTIPYIRISGPGGVIQGPAGPVQTTGGVSEGLGDIVTRGSYILPSTNPWLPSAELIGLIKFPTASPDAGLGTGEFDFGIECELTWEIQRLMPFAVVGYRFLGSSADIELNDVFEGILGAQFRIGSGINLGLLVDYREAASAQSGTRLEVVPITSFRALTHWAIDLYTSAGLADGSPDVGLGFQVSYILPNL